MTRKNWIFVAIMYNLPISMESTSTAIIKPMPVHLWILLGMIKSMQLNSLDIIRRLSGLNAPWLYNHQAYAFYGSDNKQSLCSTCSCLNRTIKIHSFDICIQCLYESSRVTLPIVAISPNIPSFARGITVVRQILKLALVRLNYDDKCVMLRSQQCSCCPKNGYRYRKITINGTSIILCYHCVNSIKQIRQIMQNVHLYAVVGNADIDNIIMRTLIDVVWSYW